MKPYPNKPYSLSDSVHARDNEYFGVYRGWVLDNEDPEERGRCKVFVPGVYDNNFIEDSGNRLPWAEPAQPLFAGGKGEDDANGTFQCPDKNSVVWVLFEAGDITQPVMIAQTTSKNGKFSTKHCTIKWEKMCIDLNREDDKNIITIYADTTINETAKTDNVNRTAGKVINDKAGVTINIEAGTDINVKAGKVINVEAGSVINIKAPAVNITGATTINGTCHITGATTIDSPTTIKAATTITADAIINGIAYTPHKHAGNLGAPTSPPF